MVCNLPLPPTPPLQYAIYPLVTSRMTIHPPSVPMSVGRREEGKREEGKRGRREEGKKGRREEGKKGRREKENNGKREKEDTRTRWSF